MYLRSRIGWESLKKRRRLPVNLHTSLLEWLVSGCPLFTIPEEMLTFGTLVMALVVVSLSTAQFHHFPLTIQPDLSPDVPTSSTSPRTRYWHRSSCSSSYSFVVLIRLWSVYDKGRRYPLEGMVGYVEPMEALGVIRLSNIESVACLRRLFDLCIYYKAFRRSKAQ